MTPEQIELHFTADNGEMVSHVDFNTALQLSDALVRATTYFTDPRWAEEHALFPKREH